MPLGPERDGAYRDTGTTWRGCLTKAFSKEERDDPADFHGLISKRVPIQTNREQREQGRKKERR